MKRFNIVVGWVNAVGYCFVIGAAVIQCAWWLALLSVPCILVAHQCILAADRS